MTAPPPSAEPPDAGELVADLKTLTAKFHEGWHDGIEIDASELVLLHTAAVWIEQAVRDMATLHKSWDEQEDAFRDLSALHADALRRLQAAQEVLQLIVDCSSQEWQEADGSRKGATDNTGERLWFISRAIMAEARAALAPPAAEGET